MKFVCFTFRNLTSVSAMYNPVFLNIRFVLIFINFYCQNVIKMFLAYKSAVLEILVGTLTTVFIMMYLCICISIEVCCLGVGRPRLCNAKEDTI